MVNRKIKNLTNLAIVESANRDSAKTQRCSLKQEVLAGMTGFHLHIPLSAGAIFASAPLIDGRRNENGGRVLDAILTQCGSGKSVSSVLFVFADKLVTLW